MISRRSFVVARWGTGVLPELPGEESEMDELARRVADVVDLGAWSDQEAKFRHEIVRQFPVSPGLPRGPPFSGPSGRCPNRPEGLQIFNREEIEVAMTLDLLKPPEVVLWTVEQCAGWMSVTSLSVRGMLRRREFPPDAVIKIGRRVRLRADLVKSWVLTGKAA
jgi:hypothetical protein